MDEEPTLLTEPREGVPPVISTLEAFDEVCERFADAHGSLAADAERASGFRYGHDDWLVQFKREGAGIALLDPIALDEAGANWNDFNDAIGDATWILHDAPQDLPGFYDIGLRPKRLFDTEMAARLLGMHRIGLAAVTEHYLHVTLAKEHSAADWSYRPLPRDWRNYAALDVELLIELEKKMRADLRRAGKDGWAEEEFQAELDTWLAPREPHPAPWLRVSHINDLSRDRQALAVVKALWVKRDELAYKNDIAPNLLLSDAAIIEAATKKPHNARQFRQIRSLNERVRVHTGSDRDKMFERYAPIQRSIKPSIWKTTIQDALALPRSQWPKMPVSGKENEIGNAPRSMVLWQNRHPERYERLERARRLMNQISQDTHTPVDVLLQPQILRNLCWQSHPKRIVVEDFLRQQGAREWQIGLLSASLSRVILEGLPQGRKKSAYHSGAKRED